MPDTALLIIFGAVCVNAVWFARAAAHACWRATPRQWGWLVSWSGLEVFAWICAMTIFAAMSSALYVDSWIWASLSASGLIVLVAIGGRVVALIVVCVVQVLRQPDDDPYDF